MSAADIEPWVDVVRVYRDDELLCELTPITRVIYSTDLANGDLVIEITARVSK